MALYRGPGVQGKELQLLIEAVEDRIMNAANFSAFMSSSDCLPLSAPGIRSLIIRDLHRSVSRIESRIKIALYPRRRTNFAATPQEVYENRAHYGMNALDSFLTPESRTYPTWEDLTLEQRTYYNNNDATYTPGTLPWGLLEPDQIRKFSNEVLYVPNKAGDEERLDGKNRAYMRLNHRYIIRIFKVALEIQDPAGLGIPYLNRSYAPSEYMVYPIEGALLLFPAQAKIAATAAANLWTSARYGMLIPELPQIMRVDYEHGFTEIPADIQDAVAMTTARRVFESVNIAATRGLLNFSVQGFSAAFGRGLYADVMERYENEADEILGHYQQIVMTGWAT